jgi:NADH-quinone oxidoreductase subunit A
MAPAREELDIYSSADSVRRAMFWVGERRGIQLAEVGRMLVQYLPFLILFIVAAGFALASLVLSRVFGPQRPNPDKLAPYESGMAPIGGTRGRFPIRYYLIALLFILFDIEIIFLYPWAVIYLSERGARGFLFAEIGAFIFVLAVGYVYLWRKGALDWE